MCCWECEGACAKEPSTQIGIDTNKSEKEGKEGGNKGEEKEEEKEKGEEMEMGEKETGRRQMNLSNHRALRIPFPVMGSCLIGEIETG